jgi:hypothetical protein
MTAFVSTASNPDDRRTPALGECRRKRRDDGTLQWAWHMAGRKHALTSEAERDRLRAYHRNVGGYLLKQPASSSFLGAMSVLEHYWKAVEFPTR